MSVVRVETRPIFKWGMLPSEIVQRWMGRALVCVAGALVGCASLQGPPLEAAKEEFGRRMAAGHRLYSVNEFGLAGRRFAEAADYAHSHRQLESEKRATVGECVSWLRARAIAEFDGCTLRLEELHERANHSQRGIGTLLALGAIAGDRPAPPFRIPEDVSRVLRKAAQRGGE